MYLGNWHLNKFTYYKDTETDNRQLKYKGIAMQADPRSRRTFHAMRKDLQLSLLKGH